MNEPTLPDRHAASQPSRRAVLRASSLVLLLGAQQIARGATIVAVRVWPAPEYSRVTIESDGALVAKQFFVTSPPRLAVDIEGIDLSPELRELVAKVKPDDPNIAGIRVGQNAPGWCAWWWTSSSPPCRRCSPCHPSPPTATGWCLTCTPQRLWTRWRH